MKIACIIEKIRVSGGAERVMCELSNGLAQRGHEVHLITQTKPTGESYKIDERVVLKNTFVKCKIFGIRNLIRNYHLHKILKDNKYDVAVSFITGMNVQAIIASQGTGVPMVVSERVDPGTYNGTLTGFERDLIYPLAKGFVFQTDDAQSCFSKKIRERSAVIPNPILCDIPEKNSYEQSNRIVAIGRLTGQKNYPLMLRAFAAFHKFYPNYDLEIYGQGNLLDELKAFAASLNIENNVKFMGQRSDIHNCIMGADMYIMTSDYEGMSNALAEAMALGLPCVATDCSGGGASFLIDNDVNGILVGRGDEEALVEALKSLADSRELRENIGTKAKEISQKLDRDNVFDTWEAYLSKIAQKY